MIIDAHVHVFPKNSRAARFVGYHNDVGELLAQMDEAEVEAAVVLGLPGYQTPEELLEICAADASRLFPVLGLTPEDPEAVNLAHEARARGFYGLKLHPRLNRYPADDPRLDPILQAAQTQGLPVLLDTIPQTPHLPMEHLDWLAFDRLAKRNPQTLLVLAHACPPNILNGFTLAKANPNVRLDLSSIVLYYAGSHVDLDIRYLSSRLDRFVLFGSDYPDFAIKPYLAAYRALIADLDDVDRERVFCRNALAVYKLPLQDR